MTAGPLAGIRVVELAAIGPAPHAAMVLADLGAEVVRIERPVPGLQVTGEEPDLVLRGRRSLSADLKDPAERELIARLIDRADVLVEGYRPGVAERLGLGPEETCRRNPRLIYARMTGWGQSGPRATTAGHDINYIALSGALHTIGLAGQKPVIPLNLVGDFGGGSMFLVVGVLAALLERSSTGQGQIVDAAMVDGANTLLQLTWSMMASGRWTDERGVNLLDGGAPFYDTYECADGKYVAVGAIEEPFYTTLLAGLGLSSAQVPDRENRESWPELRNVLAAAFAQRTRDEWSEMFAATDACVTPVLSLREAARDEHLMARRTIIAPGGALQANVAPRLSRHDATPPSPPAVLGADRAAILHDWLGQSADASALSPSPSR